MNSPSAVLITVIRSDEPRSMNRPQTKYAMTALAAWRAVMNPTKLFGALKWSTSRIGYSAAFMRLPKPKIVSDSRRRRYRWSRQTSRAIREGWCRTGGMAGASWRMRAKAMAPGNDSTVATANTIVAGVVSMNRPARVALAIDAIEAPTRTLPIAEPRSLSG